MADDMRYYETFYGISPNDWEITDFGTFQNHHKILERQYISDATSCAETSAASDTNKFLFPHHIKKKYFIEGEISGHITIASSGATSTVTSYRVTVCKTNDNTNTDSELFSTGWVTVNTTLAWDGVYSIGEERVYPFWIDAWEYEELSEYERIFVKVEVNCDNNAVLWHSNDATYEDLKVEIPLRL